MADFFFFVDLLWKLVFGSFFVLMSRIVFFAFFVIKLNLMKV